MKLFKKILFVHLIFILMLSGVALSQERPFRIEAKLGTPNLVGGAVEYLLPDVGNEFISNSLAPYFDYSSFNLSLDETVDFDYQYLGFGAKYYLDNQIDFMEGLYGGLGYGRMSLELTDDEWDTNATATGSVGVNMMQLKIGKRWIWGIFTLSLETGYSLGSMDDRVKVQVRYDDGTTETDYEDASDIPIRPGPIAAFSLGLAL